MGKKTEKKVRPRALGVDNVELFDITCFSCQKHHKLLQDGQFHCKYCGVMCENCASEHQKTPKQAGHWADKIRLISHFETPVVPTFNFLEKCETHPKRRIKSFCLDHGALCCNDCTRDLHAGCTIDAIKTMCEDVLTEAEMVESKNELSDLRRRGKKAGNAKKQEIINMARQATLFENYVRDLRERINVMFDSMVAAIVKEKDEFCKAESQLIEKDATLCDDLGPMFEVAQKHLDEAYRGRKKEDMWIAMKKLEAMITHYDGIVTGVENDKSEVRFEFVPNASLQGILEAPENMGKMKVTSSRLYGNNTDLTSKRNDAPSIRNADSKFKPPWEGDDIKAHPSPWVKSTNLLSKSKTPLPDLIRHSLGPRPNSLPQGIRTARGTIMTRTSNGLVTPKVGKQSDKGYHLANNSKAKVIGEVFGPKNTNMKITYIGRKEIMADFDAELTSVTGSAFLPNGRLVLIDNHNKNLKLYSSEYEFLSGIALEERPWNVTSCYKTVVAVSYPYDQSVEIITTGMDMKIEAKIKTDRTCHGLAFHQVEKWLYIVCGSGKNAQIQAYSLDGHLRKVIIPKHGVFQEPVYIAITSDSKRMFVSDLDNGIVGFDTKSGDVICQFRNPDIKRYWDIKLDPDGHVFVLTTDPDCIYVLTGLHNGQLLKEFRPELSKPCSISYSPINKDLVITRWKVEEIEVYRFV
ncbi:uncharacterized protein LOC127878515 [Dreissena polymorpha]|uniref:B box-type domain-containing protein n=1 Tax=Dreissena polymorpha TaxID=45954 RepID=A0A9D4QMR2_DREPO|nr:uncharacterized protein LOC127878515 [Dreissena polymorpha]KAH3836866.1 hypothetical protein DPMN_110242 [Dreissena polymorpha]